MPATKVPQPEDFESLLPALHFILKYPKVPETTTAILIVFHGLGDSDTNFAAFAENTALPGVLAITVRGVTPLPGALLGLPPDSAEAAAAEARHFHWGDDLILTSDEGDLDPDPGFAKATELVMGRLIQETLVGKCGWEPRDILLFGYGQGGSLALGLASKLRAVERVVDVTEGDSAPETAFKGVVSIGGPLPPSMIPSVSTREKSKTPVLVCHGKSSEAIDEDALDRLKDEFVDMRDVQWNKSDDGMPMNRDEMLSIMHFFSERLQNESP